MGRAHASSSPAATVGAESFAGGTAQKQSPALTCSAEQVLLTRLGINQGTAKQYKHSGGLCSVERGRQQGNKYVTDTYEHKEEKWNSKAQGAVPGRQRHHPRRGRGDFSAVWGGVTRGEIGLHIQGSMASILSATGDHQRALIKG